ncbi:hypothetical protein FPZ43_05570 [Mucilaginibacter pallidiroseus]|uniref:Uncharacterized protein n=1 Tax=Mucilaginibacter pallidiroseus TaxID=2599295 RepID=A0A563UG93_9SPHI|nr:hypothetical protein [Mucilaginibacter pallidiroseus]TWR30410.1 hypothetical protein FPZ43_05570 [Mucilaginibacter pallidiroseus]
MIETIIGLAGLLIAWLTYKKTYLDKPNEEIEHFVTQFKATQGMSVKVRQMLKQYADENKAYSLEIFNGITIQSYLIMMNDSFEKNLHDDLLKKTIQLNPSKIMLASMTKSLEEQLKALTQVESLIWSMKLHLQNQSEGFGY